MTISRSDLVRRAQEKPVAPYTVDASLTFFCPQENVEGLTHPAVREVERWKRDAWTADGPGDGRRVLLLLPCQKTKPYPLSVEHRTINRALLNSGLRPASRGDWPDELAAHVDDEALLSNAPLVGDGLTVDRAVISEPFGLVPYGVVYRLFGELSPVGRYDDPGLFEHRGLGASWRSDDTSVEVRPGVYRWGDNERAAYVEAHNRLAEGIAGDLLRVRERYDAIHAWVAPGMTHRSFVADRAASRASGLPAGRRVRGRTLPLVGVNDLHPGLVRVGPDGPLLERRRGERGGRLTATPLQDPELLRPLVADLRA